MAFPVSRQSLLVCIFLAGSALASSSFAAKSAGALARDAAKPECDFLSLTLGPAVELNAGDLVSIDDANGFMEIKSDGKSYVYDLNKGGSIEIKDPASSHHNLDDVALNGVSDASRMGHADEAVAAEQKTRTTPNMTLKNGRPVTFSRLYVNNYFVKVGAADDASYRAFAEGLLAGTYCGRPIGELSKKAKAKLKPLVEYMLMDALSTGKLEDFASWVTYRPIVSAFLDKKTIGELLETYAYRVSEHGRAVPGLALLDPDRLWTFAWNAAAKLFHDKDFVEFTDLSSFQRDGRLTFMLLGSQPIEGGSGNKYGFYAKTVGEMDVHSVVDQKSLRWTWSQSKLDYAADVSLSPVVNYGVDGLKGFRGAQNGLLVLDTTLVPKDVADLLAAYMPYFESLGFKFSDRVAIGDVPGYVQKLISNGGIDFLVREGHSDGDDENAFVLYPRGFVVNGRRLVDGREDKIDIVFNLQKGPPERRIAYKDFAQWLAERFDKLHNALVFLDGSCWGIEKAWFALAQIPPSQLIEISSNASVNFFENTPNNASHIVLDGIIKGERFDAVREKLAKAISYASGREDRFVFPDQPLYPQAGALLKIERRLFSRRGGSAYSRYTPNGYF